MAGYAIVLNDVELIYHERTGETKALEHVSFEVGDGQFVAIVGPSGCGKTSVLSLIAGTLAPSSGTLSLVGGRPGYMLQRDHLLDWRTIEGNVTLGLEVQKRLDEESLEYAMSLIDKYGLGEFRKCYPRQLSGGMRQKVALIRTLATKPAVLLLDEPFSALDYQTRLRISDEVFGIIKCEKKTALLVTHDISEAISMADSVLVFSSRPARVKAKFDIELSSADTPIKRRSAPEFKSYFDAIWEEIDA